MKNTLKKKLTMLLVVAMSFALVACGKTDVEVEDVAQAETVEEAVDEEPVEEVAEDEDFEDEDFEDEELEDEDLEDQTAEAVVTDATEVGEGATQFTFEVVDADGNTTYFAVNTDKATVGEALVDVELIEGEDSDYGLYVKTVNGITADYDVDQTYWAFYIDGEYAMTGVDATEVVAGSTYSFKVEK